MLDFESLLTIALFGFWVYCIIDVLMSDASQVRSLTKWAWLAIVVLVIPFLPIGGALWFGLARPPRAYGERTRFVARTPRPQLSRRRPPEPDPVDESVIRARIEERDRLLAQWAEEDRQKGDVQPPADA